MRLFIDKGFPLLLKRYSTPIFSCSYCIILYHTGMHHCSCLLQFKPNQIFPRLEGIGGIKYEMVAENRKVCWN